MSLLRFWERLPSNPIKRIKHWFIRKVWELRGFRRIELPVSVRNRMKNDVWYSIETDGVKWWLDGMEVLGE